MEKHPDQIRWNRKYAERGIENISIEPSNWLIQHESLLQTSNGKALDVACGNGKNSFYLADQGFEVDAVDISDVAIDWIKERAKHQNKRISSICKDLSDINLLANHYHVICNFYYLNHHLFQEYLKALVPGGLLFFETFTKEQLAINPKMRPSFCLDRNELLNAFRSLHILHYREQILERQEGKKWAVAQLVAQKL